MTKPKESDTLCLELITDDDISFSSNIIDEQNQRSKFHYNPMRKEKKNLTIRIRMVDGEEILGNVGLDVDERLSDFINSSLQFVVLINKKQMRMLNKNYIVEIAETDITKTPLQLPGKREQIQNLGSSSAKDQKNWYGS